MAKLYDTIRQWAEGQKALDACAPARRVSLQVAVGVLTRNLRQHGSLGDLATAYHEDDVLGRRLAEEFALSPNEAGSMRDAAHWQRFMEIRHPHEAKRR